MRLYVHFGQVTIILKWDSEQGTLRDLRREFVNQYHAKHDQQLDPDQLVLTAADSTRPLPLDSKVTKLLKDKDDLNIVKKAEIPQKYTSSSPTTSNAVPPSSRSASMLDADPNNEMPPLEPDLNDDFSAHIRRTRRTPPAGSIFKMRTQSKTPIQPNRRDETATQVEIGNESQEENSHTMGSVMPSKQVQAIRMNPAGNRRVNSPCSVCGEVLEFLDREDYVKCTSCGTRNHNLRIVDAQSECGRCSSKIFRRKGDVTMACSSCKSDLVVVKCPSCATPFVAPDVLSVIPCVSCGHKFVKEEQLIVSPRQQTFFLVNDGVNEPQSFSQRLKWKKATNPIHLVTQYYVDDSLDRQAEIDFCLARNIENEYIDKIHLFLEEGTTPLPACAQESQKVVVTRLGRRLKFKDAIHYCNENLRDQICIIANSDIYFDLSLRNLLQLPLGGKFLALSRVDVTNAGYLQFNEWTAPISQDAWIFRPPAPPSIDGNYFFGWLGCDNRIAHEFKSQNWHVINPSLKLICRHVHMTEKRNYTQANRVDGSYAAVPPSADF